MAVHVAVFDLGKTNKKLCCFDADLNLVEEVKQEFPPQTEDGMVVEPVDAIWEWYGQQLAALHRRHPIAAVAVTTHGATFALIDGAGQLAHPVVAYDQPLSELEQRELDSEFYDRCGAVERLQDETATCDLPMLVNPAKALLWIEKRDPSVLSKAVKLLNYPQYWAWRLTGQACAEPTYTANHSFLFDPRLTKPSSVAKALGVDHLVDCAFRKPWDLCGRLSPKVQERLGLPDIPVAVGIHDSNAALLPYLLAHRDRDFVLNSTGTWCVAMHRVDAIGYGPGELGQKIIFNIDALGHLQKASFLMGGQDYALYHKLIGGEDPGFQADRVAASISDVGAAILPGAFPSQFPGCHGGACSGGRTWTTGDLATGGPDWWMDSARAHDLLNVALAIQTKVALQRTGIGSKTTIFIEGGFRNNSTYLQVLAALFPFASVACTELQQATATGTALLAWALAKGGHPREFAGGLQISETPVERIPIPGLEDYENAYLDRVTYR